MPTGTLQVHEEPTKNACREPPRTGRLDSSEHERTGPKGLEDHAEGTGMRKDARMLAVTGRRTGRPQKDRALSGVLLVSWALRAFRRASMRRAGVAELADAPDLGSGGETREGSSPFARTIRRPPARLPANPSSARPCPCDQPPIPRAWSSGPKRCAPERREASLEAGLWRRLAPSPSRRRAACRRAARPQCPRDRPRTT